MKIRKLLFGFLIALSGLGISSVAAYFSIIGLSKIYAGAMYAVIIMASSLEISKLVVVSVLNQYWKSLSKLLKSYLIIALFVLMIITSLGIYGFLTNAYKVTSDSYKISNKETSLVELKKNRFIEVRTESQNELKSIKKNIEDKNLTLTTLRNNTDLNISQNMLNKRIKETSKELITLSTYRDELNKKFENISDSINKFEIKIIDITSKNKAAAELGPLLYLSDMTGYSMDKVVNWLTLLIVIVFDPLAICLVIVLNTLFKRKEEPIVEEPIVEEPIVEEPVVEEPVVEEPVVEEPKIDEFWEKPKSIKLKLD